MSLRLQEKVAFITGAANGIGRETAILFASHGAKVVVTDIDEDGLHETTHTIKENGGLVLAMKQDVSLEQDWRHAMETTEKEYGRLDILMNNAGVGKRIGLAETSLEQFEEIQSINSTGVFLGMKYGASLMKKSQGGSIINISSMYGIVGSPGSTAYHASKGAVRLMTKSAALELSKDFIRVNSIHPGVIVTQMSMTGAKNGVHHLKDKTPWPELGEPKDIAFGALYLASDESRYVTGSELVIDGGFIAQ
ncbi:SDR family NAD(P)-dependent oxidoreductase [Mesobacillus campisalis]|uniref:SDR family NAD(P)-dependent oxidoreductase n=1 Tax=Mesobacillus campisalis TaxID=1408103 RepID=UPI001F4C73BC|nr:glucose 1-dehydrogenase [Mesobacillus campisalis]